MDSNHVKPAHAAATYATFLYGFQPDYMVKFNYFPFFLGSSVAEELHKHQGIKYFGLTQMATEFNDVKKKSAS